MRKIQLEDTPRPWWVKVLLGVAVVGLVLGMLLMRPTETPVAPEGPGGLVPQAPGASDTSSPPADDEQAGDGSGAGDAPTDGATDQGVPEPYRPLGPEAPSLDEDPIAADTAIIDLIDEVVVGMYWTSSDERLSDRAARLEGLFTESARGIAHDTPMWHGNAKDGESYAIEGEVSFVQPLDLDGDRATYNAQASWRGSIWSENGDASSQWTGADMIVFDLLRVNGRWLVDDMTFSNKGDAPM